MPSAMAFFPWIKPWLYARLWVAHIPAKGHTGCSRNALWSLPFPPLLCPNAPCIFYGTLIVGQPHIYIGLYAENFVYFSESKAVEKAFETRLLAQQGSPFSAGLHPGPSGRHEIAGIFPSPRSTLYRSGYLIDAIPLNKDAPPECIKLFQTWVGSLKWLSISRYPDLSTVASF
eukprot:1666709-Ditylum_brightwellii.AAC.1